MSPRWLHWPDAGGGGPDAIFTGTLGTWQGGSTRWFLSGSWTGSSIAFESASLYAYASLNISGIGNTEALRFMGTIDADTIVNNHPNITAIVNIGSGTRSYTTTVASNASSTDLRLGALPPSSSTDYADGGTFGFTGATTIVIELYFNGAS